MQVESASPKLATRATAVQYGLIGSLAGTIAMDVVMVVEALILGEPLNIFLALIGSVVGGGPLVGLVLHLLMGTLLGLLFGAAVYYIDVLTIDSMRKGVWLGLLAGLVTIPFGCVPTALVAGVPVIEMVSFSFIPHLVWGAILGVIAGQGLRPDPRSAGLPATQ
jgi:ethanolamine transporter EutH